MSKPRKLRRALLVAVVFTLSVQLVLHPPFRSVNLPIAGALHWSLTVGRACSGALKLSPSLKTPQASLGHATAMHNHRISSADYCSALMASCGYHGTTSSPACRPQCSTRPSIEHAVLDTHSSAPAARITAPSLARRIRAMRTQNVGSRAALTHYDLCCAAAATGCRRRPSMRISRMARCARGAGDCFGRTMLRGSRATLPAGMFPASPR